MSTLVKSKKKLLMTAAAVILALAAIALAVIVGTSATTVGADAAIAGADAINNTTFTTVKNNINNAKDAATLGNAVSLEQARSISGTSTALADGSANYYARDLLVKKAKSLGVSYNGLASYNNLKDAYQPKFDPNDPKSQPGTYLDGDITTAVDHTTGWTSYWYGVSDGGVTVKKNGKLTLRPNNPYFIFHNAITIDGGTVEIILDDNMTIYNNMFKRETEAGLKDTTTNMITAGVSQKLENADVTVRQYSGPLFVVKSGTLKITGRDGQNVTISGSGNGNNKDKVNGGFVFPASESSDYVQANGPLIQIFSDNDNDVAKVELTYVKFGYNYNATGSGGAIVFSGSGKNSSLTINNCEILDCAAENNAAFLQLSTTVGGTFTMTNTKVYDCYANAKNQGSEGGILRSYGSNMAMGSIKNCNFYNNWTYNFSTVTWGSVSAGTLIVDGCTIENNVSYVGTAGIMCSGQMKITNTEISNNTAVTGNGGGIRVQTWSSDVNADTEIKENGSLTLGEGVTITGNKAGGSGGGIYIFCEVINTNGSVDPIYYPYKSDGTPYEMKVIVDGAEITGNSAKFGGAVYMSKSNIRNYRDENGRVEGKDNSDYVVQFEMIKGSITGNTAESGGAIYLDDRNGTGTTVDFYMSGGMISGNEATTNSGGAVYVNGGGSFDMRGGVIGGEEENDGNKANVNGGGVYVGEGNFYISGNAKIKNNVANSSGGGVYVSEGNFNMSGGTIEGNRANVNGGGIFLTGGTATVEAGLIDRNHAGGDGGATFIDAGGTFTMMGGTVSGNASGASGGAVKINDGLFYMSGGTVSGNDASVSGGAVCVEGGQVRLLSGTLSGNSTDGNGGAVYVSNATSVNVGWEECYGDGIPNPETGSWDHAPSACPVITNNTASNGGALYVVGGAPVVHCGNITNNNAVAVNAEGGNGGGIYVADAGITVNYAVIDENYAATKGGGIYVTSSASDLEIIIYSGSVSYNTANVGAGIGVDVTGSYTATITVGLKDCKGSADSDHKHPQITHNIATGKGGGLYFVSEKNDGIKFTMYCGYVGDNTANGNIPTGNILLQGGVIDIAGEFVIENATVIDGTYLRPNLGKDTVVINYHYNYPDGTEDASESTVTVALGSDERMFINLPSVDETIDGKTLVRWELKEDKDASPLESRLVGTKLILNADYSDSVGTTLNFYGVWLAVGDAYVEPPYVELGKVFSPIEFGTPYAYGTVNKPFTVQFGVSRCNPNDFKSRNLQFNRELPEGAVIFLLSCSDTKTDFYYYNVVGTELQVDISSFYKLGDPGVAWENTVDDRTKNSAERFLFIFDFSRAVSGISGTLQVIMERGYGNEATAPISQVISYSISENYIPTISATVTDTKLDTDVEITYDAGIAADEDSIYYGKQASLVISDPESKLGADSYFVYGGGNYYKNAQGVFILPIGAANTDATLTLKLHSKSLELTAGSVTLNVALYITPDAQRPLASPKLSELQITFTADAKPSVKVLGLEYDGDPETLDSRVLYTDSIPDSMQVVIEDKNVDGCTLTYSISKYNDVNGEYVETAEASIDDGFVTFASVTFGTFRVTLTLTKNEETLAQIPYNFIVLDR